jgi:hypothetical protein
MVQAVNPHAIPSAAPGVLTAIQHSSLPVAEALGIPRLLASASPPLPPIAVEIAHGVGIHVSTHR